MAGLEGKFRVAIFEGFLDAFARLPRAQQKKVSKFLRLFRSNPTARSIHYESIAAFRDPNLRTVRIDDAYRAVVLKPSRGNVYVLLWVDHHDEAMRWARNKKVSIHPATGAIQLLNLEEAAAEAEPGEASGKPDAPRESPGPFQSYSDEELLRVGVPRELLGRVRALGSLEDLDGLRGTLPPEAYEALFFLGSGESLEEVVRALELESPEEVDVADFEAALDRGVTRRSFAVVTDDEALQEVLDASNEKWRVFLHPTQRSLVERHFNGPARVLGGAGTGKTVVAMHRAAHLARHVFTDPAHRILFVTFTRNLAADIGQNLKKLCEPEELRRIEVTAMDQWTVRLLKRAGYEYEVAYWPQDSRLREAWRRALDLVPEGLDLPEGFYRAEWELVVQEHGCETLEEYLGVRRTGRGTRLSRKQRKAVWPVFEEYRNRLEALGLKEPEDAMRAASRVVADKVQGGYVAAVVDEAQDLSTAAFELLRAVVPEGPNDLFIVGDGHQRIYRRRVVLRHAGIEIRGRSRRLRINYRTTEEIRRYAVAVLEGTEVDDLDGEPDRETNEKYRSLLRGRKPTVRVYETFDQEVAGLVDWLGGPEPDRLRDCCVVARTKELRDRYGRALERWGLKTYRIRRSEPEDPERPGVRLATMHRVKGLEFRRVAVVGVSRENVPQRLPPEAAGDEDQRRDLEQRERALLYVAVTRAREDVLISAHGRLSPWVPKT